MKTIEAMALSVVRKLHGILAKGAIGEIRVKLAPAIAAAVLNEKRGDLIQMEEESEAKDPHPGRSWSMSFGEMAAEIERAEEGEAEKAPAKAPPRKGPASPKTRPWCWVATAPSPSTRPWAIHGEGPKEAKKEAVKVRPPRPPAGGPGRAGAPARPL